MEKQTRKKKPGGTSIPNFRTHFIPLIIKTTQYWLEGQTQRSNKETREFQGVQWLGLCATTAGAEV